MAEISDRNHSVVPQTSGLVFHWLCVPKTSHGDVRVKGQNHYCISKAPVPISVSKVQARFRDLVVARQINLTSGRRAKRLHQYPACGGRGSGGRDHSKLRLFRPWFSAVRPPGSARTDGPGRLENLVSVHIRRLSLWLLL